MILIFQIRQLKLRDFEKISTDQPATLLVFGKACLPMMEVKNILLNQGGGGGGGGVGHIFLAKSAIFYPYTLHGVFGRAISWSVLTSVR